MATWATMGHEATRPPLTLWAIRIPRLLMDHLATMATGHWPPGHPAILATSPHSLTGPRDLQAILATNRPLGHRATRPLATGHQATRPSWPPATIYSLTGPRDLQATLAANRPLGHRATRPSWPLATRPPGHPGHQPPSIR